MKQTDRSIILAVTLFTLLQCGMKAQERVVQMPNRDQLMSAHIRVLFQDKEGYMWYGMKSDGLYRDDGYHLVSFRSDFLHPEVQMNNNIMSLCEDQSNRLWIGTKRGLYILDKHDYSIKPTGDQKLQIWTMDAVKASTGDSIWAFANNHLLTYGHDGNCTSQMPVESNPLVTADRKQITDRRGNVWQLDDYGMTTVRTRSFVIWEEVNPDTLSLCQLVPVSRAGNLPSDTRVHAVWHAADDTKWIGTSMGLMKVTPGAEPEKVGSHFGVVNALSSSADGTIYLNTERQGLISYKDGVIAKLDSTIRNVSALCLEGKSLWITTSDGRLLVYDVAKKTVIDKSADCSLRGDTPCGVVVINGYVWVLFNQYILVYSPSQNLLQNVFPTDLSPQPLFFQGIYTDGDRRVFIECEDKTYEIRWAFDEGNPVTQEVVTLSAYETMRGTFCLGLGQNQLYLTAKERVAHLFFTTFDHLNARHIRYAYRRDDDQDWQYLELGQNEVRIIKLTPGDNIVQVKATNAFGEWSQQITTITIHVEAHWYETVWAIITYGVFAAVLIGFLIWWRRKVMKKKEKKKMEMEEKVEKVEVVEE